MKRQLFESAFKKAENQTGNNTKHGLSSHLESIFTDDLKFRTNKITFVRYYEKYIENNKVIRNNPNSDLLNKLAIYIGFKSYEDFVSSNKDEEQINETIIVNRNQDSEPKKSRYEVIIKKNKISILIITSVIIACTLIFNSLTKQRWMIWQNDHYVEVDFDIEKYGINQLKYYKAERINFFKRIEPTCDYEFFNKDGSVRVWYGKNAKKQLQYFTDLGLHPETRKTLKPITIYMKNKYICKNTADLKK